MQVHDIDSDTVEVPDDFTRLADLVGAPWYKARMHDALLVVVTAAVEVAYSELAPRAGFPVQAGSNISWMGTGGGWLLGNIWVKEVTSAAGAQIVLSGTVVE